MTFMLDGKQYIAIAGGPQGGGGGFGGGGGGRGGGRWWRRPRTSELIKPVQRRVGRVRREADPALPIWAC